MPKTLVTGATGFTGRYLAERLTAMGHEVYGTAHHADSEATGSSHIYPIDIGDPDAVARLVADVRPDKVVHLAAVAFVGHANVPEMYRSNVIGTRNLLNALATCPSPPSAVLLASSANVYGNARGGAIDESAPYAPANDYGVTKVASELLASIYAKQLPIIVVRPFNYTGRGQSSDFVIAKIVAKVRSRARTIELGNLDVSRDFSDVRAVVGAYARLLQEPRAIGETFNVCSGHAISLREVIDLIKQISGHEFEVHVNPTFVRTDEVEELFGSSAKIEDLIGSLDMPPLRDTLRWMIEE